MSRYERMNYFERLVELHVIYAMRDDEDRTGVMSIDEAISWAEAEFDSSSVPDDRSWSPRTADSDRDQPGPAISS